jgi:hypothetical protein
MTIKILNCSPDTHSLNSSVSFPLGTFIELWCDLCLFTGAKTADWFGLKPAMEFVELILIPKLDGVVMHGPFQKPVDGTLCITGHHLILSTRKEGVEELWVIDTIISLNTLTLLFSTLVVQAVHKLPFLSKRDLCTLKVMYNNLNSSVFFFHACELTETYLTL